MVLIDAIAAVEEYNLDFFIKAGAAVTTGTPEELAACCLELLAEPERRAEMSAAIAKAVPLNAAETIYETMREMHRMSVKAVDMVKNSCTERCSYFYTLFTFCGCAGGARNTYGCQRSCCQTPA